MWILVSSSIRASSYQSQKLIDIQFEPSATGRTHAERIVLEECDMAGTAIQANAQDRPPKRNGEANLSASAIS